MEELEKLADEVLAQITTEDMTLREKAWEIYHVNTHLTYTDTLTNRLMKEATTAL